MSVLLLTSCVSQVDLDFDDDVSPPSGDGVGKVITTSDFSYLLINDTGVGNEVYLSYGLAADTIQVPHASFAYSKMTNPDPLGPDSIGNHHTFSNGMIVAGFNDPNYDIILIDKNNNFNVLATIPGFGDGQSDPIFVNRVGNQLFFIIKSAATTYDLWVTDTTVAGTKMLKTVSNTYYSTVNIRERNVLFNDKMYFKGGDAVNGPELWVTDGTVSGTKMVDDYITGASGLDPRRFSVANNNLYIFSQTNQTIYQMGADEVISEVTSLPASMTSATFSENQVVSNDSYFCFKLSVSITKYLTCINTDTQVAESRNYTTSAEFLGEDGGKVYFAEVVDVDPTAATDYTAYIYETTGAITSLAPTQIHEMTVPVEILRTSQINYDNSNGAISYLKYDHTDDGDKHMFVKIKDSVVTEIDNIIYPFSTDPNITQIILYTSYSAYRSTTPGTFVYLINDGAQMLTVMQSDGTLAGTQVLTQVDLADIMADITGGNAAQGYARYYVGLLDGMSVVRPYDFSVDQYFSPNTSGLD